MLSFVMNILLATLAVMMLIKGRYGVTRQMAVVPLGAALLDTLTFGAVNPALTPALSALLVVLQVVILSLSVGVLREDAARARMKRARRRRREEMARDRAAFDRAAQRRDRLAVCA